MDERLNIGRRVVRLASESRRNADQLRAAAYELLIGRNGRSGCEVEIDVDKKTTRYAEVTT